MAAANAQIGVAHCCLLSQHPSRQHASPWWAAACNALLASATRFGRSARRSAATLIDGGALKAQVEGARAQLRPQVALYRQTILVAFQQVEDALVQQRVLEQQEQVQRAAVAAARQAERLSLNQYHAGHRALHDGGADPDRGALRRADPALSIRLSRLPPAPTWCWRWVAAGATPTLPAPYPVGGINQTPQPPMPTPQSLEPEKPWWRFWSRS